MTRFARAEGSKSSNKKTPEEATPWEVMKAQVDATIKKRKKKKTHKKDKNNDKINSEKVLCQEVIEDKNLCAQTRQDDSKECIGSIEETTSKNNDETTVINEVSEPTEKKKSKKKSKNLSFEDQKKNFIVEDGKKFKVSKNGIKKPWFDLPYEENEIMTRYKTFFVKREVVAELDNYRMALQLEGLSEKEVNKKMLRKEERAHNKLRLELLRKSIKNHKFETNESNEKSKNKGQRKSEDSSMDGNMSKNLARFDGFLVKKEAAERLEELRNKLYKKGLCKEEIKDIIQRERRKEEKSLKKEKNTFCFRCRDWGHLVSACPNLLKEGIDADAQICYKCGSAEHMSRTCPARKGNSFAHATCFVCGEVGHISRECPDNPRGLYPNGGCCNECGSVEHLKKDCPDLQKKKSENTITLATFNHGQEVEAMDDDFSVQKQSDQNCKKKSKIIRF